MRRAQILISLFAVIIISFATPCFAKTFSFAGQNPTDQESTKQMERIRDVVAKSTKGEVNLKVFPANQLGDYTIIFEELMRGTVDFALISTSNQFDERLMLPAMLFMARDYEEAAKFYEKDAYLYKLVDDACKRKNVKFLGFNLECMSGIGSVKAIENVLNPKVKKDVLIRTAAVLGSRYGMEDMGFKTVTIPYAETYAALQTGVADGWYGGGPIHNYFGFRDVIKEYYAINTMVETTCFLASEKTWKKLTPEQQGIIQEAIAVESAGSIVSAEKNDKYYMEELRNLGVKIHEYSPEELEAIFENGRDKTWPRLIPQVGEKIINDLRNEAKRIAK